MPSTDCRSEHRPRNEPGLTRSRVQQALQHRSIAPPATSQATADQGPYRPGSRQRKTRKPHAFSYTSIVHEWTLCLDAPPAQALDVDPAVLPDQWLHQLPRAAARARPRRLPGVRLLAEPLGLTR